jgi:DNA polymerase (family 10)
MEKMTKRVCGALHHPCVDALSHPTGRLIGKRPPLQLDMEKVFDTARETGVAMEINSHFLRLDLNDKHIRQAKQYGIRFVIETDTHKVEQFDYLRYGLQMARRGRLEAEDVLNTLTIKQLGKQKRNKKNFDL